MTRGYRDWAVLTPVLLASAVLVWHILQFCFVTDDAYISFVYARNLAEHGELSFNLGQSVEGYTNFLWTVMLALLMRIGIEPETSSLVLGAGFAIGTVFLVGSIARLWLAADDTTGDARFRGTVAAIAPAGLAMTSSYACWASGGLETQMFCFWLTLALWLASASTPANRLYRWVGVVLALASMTRPEGLLLVALFGGHRLFSNLWARKWPPSRDEWIAVASFLLLWAPWFGWRWSVYGYPFPNTYYVKAAGEMSASYAVAMRDNGLYYIGTWIRQTNVFITFPLALIGLLTPPISSTRFRMGTLAMAVTVVYVIYAISVGGDFMGLHRFVLPATVMVMLLAAIGVVQLARIVGRRRHHTALLVIAIALVSAHGITQLELTQEATDPRNLAADHGIDTPAYLDLYARDRALIGKHMRDCFRDTDFSIFGGVGAKPYYAHARGIDVFGLVSEKIAHQVPRTRPRAGHNKWGPDPLLLSYDPDFVFSCYSLHRDLGKPRWNCNQSFWLRHGYQPATLHIRGLRERGEYYTFWVKKEREFRCPGLVE